VVTIYPGSRVVTGEWHNSNDPAGALEVAGQLRPVVQIEAFNWNWVRSELYLKDEAKESAWINAKKVRQRSMLALDSPARSRSMLALDSSARSSRASSERAFSRASSLASSERAFSRASSLASSERAFSRASSLASSERASSRASSERAPGRASSSSSLKPLLTLPQPAARAAKSSELLRVAATPTSAKSDGSASNGRQSAFDLVRGEVDDDVLMLNEQTATALAVRQALQYRIHQIGDEIKEIEGMRDAHPEYKHILDVKHTSLVKVCRFLLSSFHPQRCYWEVVVMFRKLAMVAVVVLLRDRLQAYAMLAVLAVFFLLQVRFQPYLRAEGDDLEKLSLLSLIVTMFVSLVAKSENISSGGLWKVMYGGLGLYHGLVMLVFMVHLTRGVRNHVLANLDADQDGRITREEIKERVHNAIARMPAPVRVLLWVLLVEPIVLLLCCVWWLGDKLVAAGRRLALKCRCCCPPRERRSSGSTRGGRRSSAEAQGPVPEVPAPRAGAYMKLKIQALNEFARSLSASFNTRRMQEGEGAGADTHGSLRDFFRDSLIQVKFWNGRAFRKSPGFGASSAEGGVDESGSEVPDVEVSPGMVSSGGSRGKTLFATHVAKKEEIMDDHAKTLHSFNYG